MRFDRFMELALYDPEAGFYSVAGSAGRRRGDFITSPEVGPLFGAVVARALDKWWNECGRPEAFVVAEAAAGRGALARAILAAEPVCLGALDYRLVETSPALRAEHDDLLARGMTSTAEWPDTADVILANELLDNLPIRILERTDAGWSEVAIDATGEQVLVALHESPPPACDDVPVGAQVPWAQQGIAWVERARALAAHRVVVFDYGATTVDLAARVERGWLRGYRDHGRVNDVLAMPGTCDITVDVPFDQLPEPLALCTQTDWLRGHGIDDLTATARTRWEAERAIGGLAAIRARSALLEAEALQDSAGLGAFTVAEW